MLKRNFIGTTSNPLIKKECIDEVGHFDIQLQASQDYDLWLRIAKKYPISYVRKPLINYYIHSGEQISDNIDKQIAGTECIIEKYSKDIIKDNKIWYLRQRDLVIAYAKKRWKKKAFLLCGKCFMKYPWDIPDYAKMLLLIVFGCDSLPYQTYRKAKDSINTLFRKR